MVRFSYSTLAIILTVVALLCYGAFVLYGTWIDGRRQSVRDSGMHPVTDATGQVHAREDDPENPA